MLGKGSKATIVAVAMLLSLVSARQTMIPRRQCVHHHLPYQGGSGDGDGDGDGDAKRKRKKWKIICMSYLPAVVISVFIGGAVYAILSIVLCRIDEKYCIQAINPNSFLFSCFSPPSK